MNARDFDVAVRGVHADIVGVGVVPAVHLSDGPATFYTTPTGTIVRVDWKGAEPSSTVKNAVQAAILAARPLVNRLDALRAKRREGKGLSAAEQLEVLDLFLGV